MSFIYSTLPNGLRIVSRRVADTPAEMCGLAINAGSRDELPGEHGLAHFVEHTIFKGTARRRAWHINNRMESVGGELNAYTTKEETFIYTIHPSAPGLASRSLELLTDLVTSPAFPDAELEREREVVCDEISSYLDSPSESIFDEFEDLIYTNNPLGHNILGTEQSVLRLTSDDCRRWVSRNYSPGCMVLFYSGTLTHDRIHSMALRMLGSLQRPDNPRRRIAPNVLAPFERLRTISAHQAHTVTGARIPGLGDSMSTAMALVVNTLGGPGMNSLLNVALREKRGLVYSIDASTALLTDTGLMTIYYGCDPDDLRRCRTLVSSVVNRLANDGLSPRRLDSAKRQLTGQLRVAEAAPDNAILAAARSTLHLGRALESHETTERIEAVTADAFRRAAAMLVSPSTLTLL